jgi:hypothetical protein
VSKERARRREEREREAATRKAAREAGARRTARRQALLAPITGPVRRTRVALTTGRQTGVLAERKRKRLQLIVTALVLAQVLVWVFRDDWPARLAALVVALLAFPVIAAFAL